MKLNLGDKYYKVDENKKIEIIRIIRIKSKSIIVLTEDKKKISISENQLDEYTKLKPDAYITFSIVTLELGMKDIIVSIHRRKDIEDGIQSPYAACRQSILDLFANQIIKEDTYYIGCSMSKDTCPVDVDYNILLSCNSIEKMYMVSAYMDDTLEDWLTIIPVNKFDEVLRSINGKIEGVFGYSETLKELLELNCFMYDFHKGFNIDDVPFELKYDKDTLVLDIDQTTYLEDLYKNEMFTTLVIKFNKEISLDKIERYYVLVCDSKKELYIVAYDRGEYINRIYKKEIKDKRDAVMMLKYCKS